MPIYEYSCKKCGKTIEVIQKFSDSALKKHEGCGGALTKLISASSFHLKGAGWYVTDYARKGKTGESESSSQDTAGETKDTKAAGDTKEKKESPKSEKPSKESSKESSTKKSDNSKKSSES